MNNTDNNLKWTFEMERILIDITKYIQYNWYKKAFLGMFISFL